MEHLIGEWCSSIPQLKQNECPHKHFTAVYRSFSEDTFLVFCLNNTTQQSRLFAEEAQEVSEQLDSTNACRKYFE